MDTEKKPKRSYNSTRRKEQARQTQRLILTAARQLFIERGYSGATIEAIAQEAGVAAETIYATFGNKSVLLSRLIGVSLTGDDDPTPIFQRKEALAIQNETDPVLQVQLFANDMTHIMGRVAALFSVMRSAAKTEADIADLLQKTLNERLEGLKVFTNALLSNGALRDNQSAAEAAETVWAISSAEVYTLLVIERNWSVEKYTHWLANTLSRLLLA